MCCSRVKRRTDKNWGLCHVLMMTLCFASVPEVCLKPLNCSMGSLHSVKICSEPLVSILQKRTLEPHIWVDEHAEPPVGEVIFEVKIMVPYGTSNYSDSLIWVRTGLVSYKMDLFQSLAIYFVGLTTTFVNANTNLEVWRANLSVSPQGHALTVTMQWDLSVSNVTAHHQ